MEYEAVPFILTIVSVLRVSLPIMEKVLGSFRLIFLGTFNREAKSLTEPKDTFLPLGL